jgi:hypothetical protein
MNKILFKYKKHPGDLLRNVEVNSLPNPDENLEEFLVWFLNSYQSDGKVTYYNDLFKLLHNEFFDDIEKEKFIKMIGDKNEKQIKEEIKSVENNLKEEAYKNFYNLILNNKIEIIIDGQK